MHTDSGDVTKSSLQRAELRCPNSGALTTVAPLGLVLSSTASRFQIDSPDSTASRFGRPAFLAGAVAACLVLTFSLASLRVISPAMSLAARLSSGAARFNVIVVCKAF